MAQQSRIRLPMQEMVGSIPGLGRSPGEGNGYPFQYSCLGNPMAEKPGGLQSMESQVVGHNLVTKQMGQ